MRALSGCMSRTIPDIAVSDMQPDSARMAAAAAEGYSTATDLADWLVCALKLPFREAHHITGRIVAAAAK